LTLFGLIHGGWHTAAHWDRLIPEIQSRGHRAVAMDLPCETEFVDSYIEPAARAIEDARNGEDVVVVGHSFGGFSVPHVADIVGAKHRVYLCALLQSPGKTVAETLVEEMPAALSMDVFAQTTDNGDGSISWQDLEAAKASLYHDCSPEDADWAASLLRAQYIVFGENPGPIDLLAGPSTYVLCRDDRVVLPVWSRKRVPEWLGVSPIEMDGSHSPFISRPGDLAEILVSVA
jgi:pimeloyl-ACP methyl ester carboxylesterase